MGFQTDGFHKLVYGLMRLGSATTTGVTVTNFKLALMLNTFDFDAVTYTNYASISGHELSATGYTAGGNALAVTDSGADPKRVWVTGTRSIAFRHSDLVFSSLVNAAAPVVAGVALYDTTNNSVLLTSKLVSGTAYSTFTLSATAQTLTLQFNSSGFFGFTF